MEETRSFDQTDSGQDTEQVRASLISAYYTEESKIQRLVDKYEEYIDYMVYHHPCSASDIAEGVGPHKKAVCDILKVLMNNDLVVRIKFEYHCLYVLNGNYNRFFPKVEKVG